MSEPYNSESKNLLPRWILANKLMKAAALLEQADCPNRHVGILQEKCRAGMMEGVESTSHGLTIVKYDKPCPWCADRKEVLDK